MTAAVFKILVKIGNKNKNKKGGAYQLWVDRSRGLNELIYVYKKN